MATLNEGSPYHQSLSARHAALEGLIESELKRPQPDDQVLKDLKRRKLRLKDEMEGHFDRPEPSVEPEPLPDPLREPEFELAA